MGKEINLKRLALSLLIACSGCAVNSGVVQTGKDSFMVSRQAATGFTGSGNLKAEAINEASEHCATKNKSLLLISSTEAPPPYIFGNFPKAEIQFKCAD